MPPTILAFQEKPKAGESPPNASRSRLSLPNPPRQGIIQTNLPVYRLRQRVPRRGNGSPSHGPEQNPSTPDKTIHQSRESHICIRYAGGTGKAVLKKGSSGLSASVSSSSHAVKDRGPTVIWGRPSLDRAKIPRRVIIVLLPISPPQ